MSQSTSPFWISFTVPWLCLPLRAMALGGIAGWMVSGGFLFLVMVMVLLMTVVVILVVVVGGYRLRLRAETHRDL